MQANTLKRDSLQVTYFRRGGKSSAPESQKLQIGVNASMLDSKPTGVGIFTYNLINHMHRQLMRDDSKDLTVFSPAREFLDDGLRIAHVPKFVQSSEYPRSSAISRFTWNQLVYPVVAGKMDILLNLSTHGHLWGGRQVLTIHDLISLRYPDVSPHQQLYFKKFLPWMIRKSAGIITVSECTKQDVIRQFGTSPEKIYVVGNGFDRNQFFPETTKGFIRDKYGVSNYILAVGPTYPHKNFDTLIKAFALFSPEERKQNPLLIAGGRPGYIEYLRKITAEAGLTDVIHFVGYVPQNMMPALYREARMLVFPSLYEGFGIPLLEAMACGCPVVSSNVSSMPEICHDAAYYVDPTSASSIFHGIKRVIEEYPLSSLLSDKGILRAKHYSWERAAAEVTYLLAELSKTHKIRKHV